MMQEIGGASSVRGEACGVALQGLLIANPGVTVQEVHCTWLQNYPVRSRRRVLCR